ncbi:MAG TPA: tetratricopeptide repeat protein [Dongiaceae bacterium]|nr:tetratricopeptide repeat protein [Dongiaceae bacterium]
MAAVGVLCLALAAGPASAADDREPGGRTVLGYDANLRACTTAATQGDVSDRALGACNAALGERNIGDNDRVTILVDRGVIHLNRREGDDAIADFNAAIVILPRNGEAHLNLGAALVQLHRPGPAVAELTQALSLGVSQPHKAYYNRGAAREALGDLRGAYEDYTTALEIEPDWGPAEAEVARFVRSRQERLAGVLNPQGAGADPPPSQGQN